MAPEDEVQGVETPPERAKFPVGAYVIQPFDEDKLVVNGVELTRVSKLTDLRAACTCYNLSNSGGKDKCYIRLVAHMKQLELELIEWMPICSVTLSLQLLQLYLMTKKLKSTISHIHHTLHGAHHVFASERELTSKLEMIK